MCRATFCDCCVCEYVSCVSAIVSNKISMQIYIYICILVWQYSGHAVHNTKQYRRGMEWNGNEIASFICRFGRVSVNSITHRKYGKKVCMKLIRLYGAAHSHIFTSAHLNGVCRSISPSDSFAACPACHKIIPKFQWNLFNEDAVLFYSALL